MSTILSYVPRMYGYHAAPNTRRPRVHTFDQASQSGHTRPVVLTGEWYSLDKNARRERYGSVEDVTANHPAFRTEDISMGQPTDSLPVLTNKLPEEERSSTATPEEAQVQELINSGPKRLRKRQGIPVSPGDKLNRSRSISATVGRMYRNVSGTSLLSMLSGERRPQTAPYSGQSHLGEERRNQGEIGLDSTATLPVKKAESKDGFHAQSIEPDRRKPSLHHDNDEIRQAMERSASKRQPLRDIPVNVPPHPSGSFRQRTKQRVLSIRKKIDKTIDVWRE